MQGRYDARKHYGKTQHFKQKEKNGLRSGDSHGENGSKWQDGYSELLQPGLGEGNVGCEMQD